MRDGRRASTRHHLREEFAIADGEVGFFIRPLRNQEAVKILQVIAGDSSVEVMFEVVVEVVGRDERLLPPAHERRSRVLARVEIEEVGHGAMFRDLAAAGSWRERLRFAFGPPGWSPDGSRKTTAMLKAEWRARLDRAEAAHPTSA